MKNAPRIENKKKRAGSCFTAAKKAVAVEMRERERERKRERENTKQQPLPIVLVVYFHCFGDPILPISS